MKIKIPKGFQEWLSYQIGYNPGHISMVFAGKRPVNDEIANMLVKLLPDTHKLLWQSLPFGPYAWIMGEELYNKTRTDHWKRKPNWKRKSKNRKG